MSDEKFIYNHKVGFKLLPSVVQPHAWHIDKQDFDDTIRGIILYNENIIYLRINPMDYKGLRFEDNFKECTSYLKKKYKEFKIHTSYTINELPKKVKNYLLFL